MPGLLYTAMNNYILAPSTIAADLTRLAEQIAAYESAGADWLHVETCPDLVKTGIAHRTGVRRKCRWEEHPPRNTCAVRQCRCDGKKLKQKSRRAP